MENWLIVHLDTRRFAAGNKEVPRRMRERLSARNMRPRAVAKPT